MTHHILADRAERVFCRASEDHEAEEHPDAGRAESVVPADGLTEEAGDDLTHEGAEVDAHVEDREAGIAACAALGVEVTDDRRDVRLEQAGAEDDQDQSEEEEDLPCAWAGQAGEADGEVSGGDERGAQEDRAPQSEPAVSDPAAGKRGEVDRGRVDADDRRGLRAVEAEAAVHERGGHEEDEERAESVEGEPLPHLREKERREAARVAEESAVVDVRCDVGRGRRAVLRWGHCTGKRGWINGRGAIW